MYTRNQGALLLDNFICFFTNNMGASLRPKKYGWWSCLLWFCALFDAAGIFLVDCPSKIKFDSGNCWLNLNHRMVSLTILEELTVLTLRYMLFPKDLLFFLRCPCWELKVQLLWVFATVKHSLLVCTLFNLISFEDYLPLTLKWLFYCLGCSIAGNTFCQSN